MNPFRVQFKFRWCLVASLAFLPFFGCQEAGQDNLHAHGVETAKDEGRQRVPVPAWFTPDSASKLGHHLDSIFTYLHKRKGLNGTVLVTKYDEVVYTGAFGYGDFRSKDSLHTQSVFQLASVSKQFTAMAVMMLQEQGKLQYDDSVQQHIPDFPYHGITIRQLLTHRSGLSNYTYFSDELWHDRKVPIYNDDVLKIMAEHRPNPYFRPDARFDYSNTGYFLLASIVERASGMPFSEFLQQRIFKPLQMTNTFTFSDSLVYGNKLVVPGHTGGRRKRWPDYLDTVLGDKGMYSTVEDLYKWDQALYTNKLVKQETLEKAFTGSRQERKKDEDYGFGWRIKQVPNGDTVVYHGGLWHGYATYLLRNPNDHSALIILSNVPNGSFRYLRELEAFLYPTRPEDDKPEEKIIVVSAKK
ncbi:CubicO group peptidase (beta-lactamase class C family) [Pontibacter mucosus]|uniref:CubicO group peptidase (Beta-lactamase class C family) n=1 Tax=Pontibacter mucosus TaxID=1649266 RepID=A0A2T5YCI3_9BACT|nr:CubicO group peptidase (beta-lactamase class C family) [Pontibacter mucosus]